MTPLRPLPCALRRSAHLLLLLCFLLAGCLSGTLHAQASLAPVPDELSSTHFMVELGGHRSPVVHAAANYYLLNFTMTGPVDVVITAEDPHFWDAGVEVQPMRLGIRPSRNGAPLRFRLASLAKLSITRPGDHFGTSEMLFLFANAPDTSGITAAAPGIRFYGPGVHRGSITARSGDTLYLADGAVVLGALNLWQVHDVKVLGRGILLYDGPQDPDHDQGWMHKKDWHVIVMDKARNIDIEGITAIVRSRTWMVQMRRSHGIRFRNVKILGGSKGNANQDGMDWLGGGDTLVQDTFIRAADDIFAMYGGWDGYSARQISKPGDTVGNITIENSVLSTSISNVVRLSWPHKNFASHDFTLRDSDILHMGAGACGIPFALFEVWADGGGHGTHRNYTFDDLRMDDLYSVTQLIQTNPSVQGVHFNRVSAMDGPALLSSQLKGNIADVTLAGVDQGRAGSAPLVRASEGAQPASVARLPAEAGFTYSGGLIQPGTVVTFTAAPVQGARYHWLFGDGTSTDGPVVRHAFPDAEGTMLDGTGRFRVLLAVTDATNATTWTSQPVIVAHRLLAALDRNAGMPAPFAQQGSRPGATAAWINVPADGGYSLVLLTSTRSLLAMDGVEAHNAPLQAQVCGSIGYAVQAVRLDVALAAGQHRLTITRGPEVENAESDGLRPGAPVLLWQGPKLPLQPVPASALSFRTP